MENKEYNFLITYLSETNVKMRHLENLRGKISSLILTLASSIAGFIVWKDFDNGTELLSIVIIAIGIFGILMTRKIYQVHQYCQSRLNHWYLLLEEKYNVGDVLKYRDRADIEHHEKFWFISKIPHNYFWSLIHSFIIVIGILTLFMVSK